ncbi:MAG: AtpZ/AtpI family protein [Egibacteraceae bacterium]
MAEFISAILTWGGIGWLLDRWLHTTPWLVAIGFVIGIVAGFYLMYVRSHGMIATAPQRQGVGGSPPTNQEGGEVPPINQIPPPADGSSTTEHTI